MPAARIMAILAEIGTLTKSKRIQELTIELGALLAATVDSSIYNDARLTRLQDNTTRAIVDTEQTLDDHIIDLRTAIQGLTQLVIRRMADMDERNETITGRVHTLANHMMAVEEKVSELAEVVTILLDQSTDDSLEDGFNVDGLGVDDYNAYNA
jgi:hypothetical protein